MVINNNMKLFCRRRFIIKICYNTQLLLFNCKFCMEPKWYLLQTNDLPHMVPASHAVLLNDACNFFFQTFLNLISALCIACGFRLWESCRSKENAPHAPMCKDQGFQHLQDLPNSTNFVG